jgi:hypothetical protein
VKTFFIVEMPSKKKSKGSKARRKAKNAEGKKKHDGAEESVADEQEAAPDVQMQRLKINEDSQAEEDALLEEAIQIAAAERKVLNAKESFLNALLDALAPENNNSESCHHGYDPDYASVATEIAPARVVAEFTIMFCSVFRGVFASTDAAGDGDSMVYIAAVDQAITAAEQSFPQVKVLDDASKLKLVVSIFLKAATQSVLDGNIHDARIFASFADWFKNRMSIVLHGAKATLNCAKMIELQRADEHTLVKYLRKSTPCNCLDGKYKEVKSIIKMGVCCNPQCHLPGRMVERRTMVYCTRCRQGNYCSRECQVAAWPSHKEVCDELGELERLASGT